VLKKTVGFFLIFGILDCLPDCRNRRCRLILQQAQGLGTVHTHPEVFILERFGKGLHRLGGIRFDLAHRQRSLDTDRGFLILDKNLGQCVDGGRRFVHHVANGDHRGPALVLFWGLEFRAPFAGITSVVLHPGQQVGDVQWAFFMDQQSPSRQKHQGNHPNHPPGTGLGRFWAILPRLVAVV